MAFRFLSELVRSLRLRAEGIAEAPEELAAVGLGQQHVDQCRAVAAKLEALNAERESLKGAMLAKTAEIKAETAEALKWRKFVSAQIKYALRHNRERWVSFGIYVKR